MALHTSYSFYPHKRRLQQGLAVWYKVYNPIKPSKMQSVNNNQ